MSILFQPEHIDAIRAGAKTETRRTWDPEYPRPTPGSIRGAVTELFVERDTIDCWLRIEGVHQEPLGALDAAAADAEGGYTVAEFRNVWRDLHSAWHPEQIVDVVGFEYVGRAPPGGGEGA